ncbi:MAG: hypothetical protein MN733_28190 [Nitrososphaera sp.]|nr:hypothetical protein [Nitrososphaera sp.]
MRNPLVKLQHFAPLDAIDYIETRMYRQHLGEGERMSLCVRANGVWYFIDDWTSIRAIAQAMFPQQGWDFE